MKTLQDRLKADNALLAPYGVPLQGMLGRMHDEPEDETRFAFQRDRDRIIHAQAFRRLQGKTQVFVAGEGDHYRTRLTHTMEVAQIIRDIARTLGLNEDLSECIALAHDLGHPPFGHMGEQALDQWMRAQGASFEHNEQSLHIVTVLEEHAKSYEGLNLHREVLEGLQKHRLRSQPRSLSLEAQAVNLADEIAYLSHDCDDGLRAGLFKLTEITDVPLAALAAGRALKRGTSMRGSLIQVLVLDLYKETSALLAERKIASLESVYMAQAPLVNLSSVMRSSLKPLQTFLHDRLYSHPTIIRMNSEGQQIIQALCARFSQDPPRKVEELKRKHGGTLPVAVKDYIAGMTDAYARAQSGNPHP